MSHTCDLKSVDDAVAVQRLLQRLRKVREDEAVFNDDFTPIHFSKAARTLFTLVHSPEKAGWTVTEATLILVNRAGEGQRNLFSPMKKGEELENMTVAAEYLAVQAAGNLLACVEEGILGTF